MHSVSITHQSNIQKFAKLVGFSIARKKNRLRKLLSKVKKLRWTEEEIRFLKENYGVIESFEIANKLGRSYSAIYHKAGRLGLSRK